MSVILSALALVLIAGFINGSFATPMKYMVKWEEENTWFAFSFWGFLILPWVSILFMCPNTLEVVGGLPSKLFWTIVLGGLAFGLGQICFVLAFRYIGIGLAFVVNISMGTAGSALIPILWHKGILGTPYSYVQLAGILVFIFAVCFGAAAGAARDQMKKTGNESAEPTKTKKIEPGKMILGTFLAVLAGAGSVAQGVTYIWANPTVSKIAEERFASSELASDTIAWVLIFSAAWLPYALYFLYLSLKRKSLSHFGFAGTGTYWVFIVLMGVGFWGSLIFFSRASGIIGGDLAPTVAWPLFMVFIILTSNFWSWKSGEWHGAGSKAFHRMAVSLVLFVVAIIVFSFSSGLQPKDDEAEAQKRHKIYYHHIKHSNYPTHKLSE